MARTTHRIAVLDVETTGFSGADRILEIGIITFDSQGQEEERFETLIQPDRDIPNSAIHGISASMLDAAPRFAEVAGQIASLLDDHVVVAHNASFDTRMLNQEFSRLGHTLTGSSLWSIDTMRLSKFLLPGRPAKLADALAVVGIENPAAHTALADAEATAKLFYELLDRGAMTVAHPLTMPAGALRLGTESSLPRPVNTGQRETDAYQDVLIAALDDGHLGEEELDQLVAKAAELGLTQEEAHDIHVSMLGRMAMQAWADGILTDDEAALLRSAAQSLQVEPDTVARLLAGPGDLPDVTLTPGDRISFTGALELPRESWEDRVRARGFTIGGVIKSSGVLVAADPASRSGKATKARRFGIPIITETQLAWLLRQNPEQEAERVPDVGEDQFSHVFPWSGTEPAADVAAVAASWVSDHPATALQQLSPRLNPTLPPDGIDTSRLSMQRWLAQHPRPLTASVNDLRDLKGWGAKTVDDTVRAVVTAALDAADPADGEYAEVLAPDPYAPLPVQQEQPAAEREDSTAPALSDADRLVEWFALCRTPLTPLLSDAPEDVSLAAQRVDEQGEAIRLRLAAQAAEELKHLLSDDIRSADILQSRILADEPDTLDTVGQRWEVTRERIRQLEVKLRARVGEIVHSFLAALPHRVPRPVRATEFTRLNSDLTVEVHPGLMLLDVLLALSDEVVRRGEWIEPATAHQDLEEIVLAAVDAYGVLALEDLADCGPAAEADRTEWITSLAGSWVIRGAHVFTWTKEYGDRAAAVLSVINRPMTGEEIIDYIGQGSVRSLNNALGRDDRMHRIGPGRWGLVEWGDEEFTNVANWIAARVDQHGSYPLAQLLEEARDLGVADTTVRTYSSNGEFVIEDELVLRNTESVDAEANPEVYPGMFYRDGGWQLLITVNHDHLRGSGSSVPRCLVGMFEVPFLDRMVFRSALGDQELKFGRTNATTGTIRRFLSELGSVEGDRVWLHFGTDGTFEVSPATDRTPTTGLADVLNYCGMDDRGADLATLNEALGLAPNAPRRRTVSRFNHRREEEFAAVVREL